MTSEMIGEWTDLPERLAARMRENKMPGARVWAKDDIVRVYTGVKGEYVQIVGARHIHLCRDRMSWSHVIREIAESMGLVEVA